MTFNIIKAGHVEYFVTDLEKARDFYVEKLGFIQTERVGKQLFLRGIEERYHHSLVLTEHSEPGMGHMAFRVGSEKDLDDLFTFLKQNGLEPFWFEEERGVGRSIRVQDPLGFPVEFYYDMKREEWFLRKFSEHGGARVMRIDHFNIHVPDAEKAFEWYKSLGFVCTEITETEDEKPRIWAAWLRRKHTCHDVAVTTGKGPRLHHTGFTVYDRNSIMDCADILASSGYLGSMERGPGRHGISNAFFLYLRDRDLNRIELYTGDYLSADPDWEPVIWKLNDPQRQTFWGAPAPSSWFDDAMRVINFKTRLFIEVRKSVIKDRPDYIAE